MTDIPIPDLVEALRPYIENIVQAAVQSAMTRQQGMSISTGTVIEVNGPDVDVLPDDATDGVTVGATAATQPLAEGSRVYLVHFPPAGALVLPGIPDPTP